MNNFDIEDKYNGHVIAGIDEAGRGSLAGPVVAAAVIVDRNIVIDGIKDSKKMRPTTREDLYLKITENYVWAVGIVPPEEIDTINIYQATIKACNIAAENLTAKADIVLVDGNMKFADQRFKSIIKGDDKSISIAAASIVAKVTRDRIMTSLAVDHPDYAWHRNFGYGTKQHLKAITAFGITEKHRRSFKIKEA
jgi:ribonuclease HII